MNNLCADVLGVLAHLVTGAAFVIGWLMLDGEHDEFDMWITGRISE